MKYICTKECYSSVNKKSLKIFVYMDETGKKLWAVARHRKTNISSSLTSVVPYSKSSYKSI